MTTVVRGPQGRQGGRSPPTALVTFGDTRLAHGYEANEKLFKVGDSWSRHGRHDGALSGAAQAR